MSKYKEYSHEALCLLIDERDAKIYRLKEELESSIDNYSSLHKEWSGSQKQLAEAKLQLELSKPLYSRRQLEQQLAKANAEVQFYKEAQAYAENQYLLSVQETNSLIAQVKEAKEHAADFGNALITVQKQARKAAARDVEKQLLGMFWTIPYKENEAMIYRDQAIEWLRGHFGLEVKTTNEHLQP